MFNTKLTNCQRLQWKLNIKPESEALKQAVKCVKVLKVLKELKE